MHKVGVLIDRHTNQEANLVMDGSTAVSCFIEVVADSGGAASKHGGDNSKGSEKDSENDELRCFTC